MLIGGRGRLGCWARCESAGAARRSRGRWWPIRMRVCERSLRVGWLVRAALGLPTLYGRRLPIVTRAYERPLLMPRRCSAMRV